MIKNKLTLLAILALTILVGCEKDDDDEPQDAGIVWPQIAINEPAEDYYHHGDTAWVDVLITDSDEMHEAFCWLITRPQNDTLWSLYRHSHGNTIQFESYYVVGELPDEQEVEVLVSGENDRGDISTASHFFEVHDH